MVTVSLMGLTRAAANRSSAGSEPRRSRTEVLIRKPQKLHPQYGGGLEHGADGNRGRAAFKRSHGLAGDADTRGQVGQRDALSQTRDTDLGAEEGEPIPSVAGDRAGGTSAPFRCDNYI